MTFLYANIKFDREITDKHYIVPGGYDMTFSNGKTVQFDFQNSSGYVDMEDKTSYIVVASGLDLETFPESEFIEHFIGDVAKINEFFVYTGEHTDPDINPVELVTMFIKNNHGVIEVNPNQLGRIWKG